MAPRITKQYIISVFGIFGLILLLLLFQNTDLLHQSQNKNIVSHATNGETRIDFRQNKSFAMRNVNCEGVIEGNIQSINEAKAEFDAYVKYQSNAKGNEEMIFSDGTVSSWTDNCKKFITSRKYITSPINTEEENFPIAYIISIYKDLQSFENLLRAIYRPQNIYCIHVDQKSLAEFQTGVLSVIKCFENVFLATHMTRVWYTHWTIVQASLNCMEDLVNRKKDYPWKYAINLCGQDLPTKTNLEMVKAMKKLGGYNSIPSVKFDENEDKRKRYEFVHVHAMDLVKGNHYPMKITSTKKKPPPHDIKIFSGSDYFIFKRSAVEFLLSDSKIRDFFEWSKDTKIPDEMVWATLQRMYPRFPGSEPQDEMLDKFSGSTLTRTRMWNNTKQILSCDGMVLRKLCVYGLSNLKWVVTQKQFFANKFSPEVNIFAINCLIEWVQNKTFSESHNYLLH